MIEPQEEDRLKELIQIGEQILKANNAGVREIKVIANDFVATRDGVGILFLSTNDFEEFKKRQDPTKNIYDESM